MKIEKISVYTVSLPFAFDFSHAQRKRTSTKNVVVEITAEGGAVFGFGEGAPRSYVTGETASTAPAHIAAAVAHSAFCWDFSAPDQILTTANVTFGPGGRAGALPGPGLGVEIDRNALEKLSEGRQPVVVKRP